VLRVLIVQYTRDANRDSRLKDKDTDKDDPQGRGQGPRTLTSMMKSRTFDFFGICHANIHNFRGHVWLGFCASMLFSSCVA